MFRHTAGGMRGRAKMVPGHVTERGGHVQMQRAGLSDTLVSTGYGFLVSIGKAVKNRLDLNRL